MKAYELVEAIPPLPTLPVEAHKGIAGRLLLFAGSKTMPGAALLAARAAQRAGAGLVSVAVFDAELMRVLPASAPEAVYLDLCADKALIRGHLPRAVQLGPHHLRVAGPGLGRQARTRELVRLLLADRDFGRPLVLDADALNVIGGELDSLAAYAGPLLLTPHPGEAEGLLGRALPNAEEARVECALELARRSAGICILKGHRSIVTDGRRLYINSSGNPGMATAGSGDVLCGILGAYLGHARRSQDGTFGPFEAAVRATWMHGRAGDLAAEQKGKLGLIASDLIEFLPRAQLTSETPG